MNYVKIIVIMAAIGIIDYFGIKLAWDIFGLDGNDTISVAVAVAIFLTVTISGFFVWKKLS